MLSTRSSIKLPEVVSVIVDPFWAVYYHAQRMLARMKRVRLDSPHGRSATEVLAALNVSFATGLSDHEVEQRLSVYGANAIGTRQKVGLISVLVHQFQSLVVALLAVAAAVAFYFREWEEGGAIVGVLILNTAIGFVTEIKAVRSIEAIRALGSRSARVLRGGRTRLIPAERLVPGDIVLLDAGDVIRQTCGLWKAPTLMRMNRH
jgi:Ca2+-transporting ATPase